RHHPDPPSFPTRRSSDLYDSLFILAASQTRDKDALSRDGVDKVLKELAEDGFDFVICDSPAGIEKGAALAMYFADRAVVVVNPEDRKSTRLNSSHVKISY